MDQMEQQIPQAAMVGNNPLEPNPNAPQIEWIQARIPSADVIPNVCQQFSNAGWMVVSVVFIPGKLIGSESYGIVAWRPIVVPETSQES